MEFSLCPVLQQDDEHLGFSEKKNRISPFLCTKAKVHNWLGDYQSQRIKDILPKRNNTDKAQSSVLLAEHPNTHLSLHTLQSPVTFGDLLAHTEAPTLMKNVHLLLSAKEVSQC